MSREMRNTMNIIMENENDVEKQGDKDPGYYDKLSRDYDSYLNDAIQKGDKEEAKKQIKNLNDLHKKVKEISKNLTDEDEEEKEEFYKILRNLDQSIKVYIEEMKEKLGVRFKGKAWKE